MSNQTKFVCQKCNVDMITFASAAVWCSRGHRMEPEEKINGKDSAELQSK